MPQYGQDNLNIVTHALTLMLCVKFQLPMECLECVT